MPYVNFKTKHLNAVQMFEELNVRKRWQKFKFFFVFFFSFVFSFTDDIETVHTALSLHTVVRMPTSSTFFWGVTICQIRVLACEKHCFYSFFFFFAFFNFHLHCHLCLNISWKDTEKFIQEKKVMKIFVEFIKNCNVI